MASRRRLLILGLDGATWDVIEPFIEAGVMPCLASLRARGSWGRLRSTIPPITPAAWSTVMTGKGPGGHGVFHFLNRFTPEAADEGGDETVDGFGAFSAEAADADPDATPIVSSRSIRSPAFWDVLGHEGVTVGLVNIPLTYPPRPVNGFMVTGLLTPPNATVFTYPPELSAELPEHVVEIDRFAGRIPFVDVIDGAIVEPSLELIRDFHAMLNRRAAEARMLQASRPWDVFMAVFMETDRLGHYLWAFHQAPTNGDPQAAALHAAVRALYARIDEVIGELVAAAGPETNVLLLSDHGMGPKHRHRFHANAWLASRALLGARSRGGALAAAEQLLRRVGLPRDRIGRLVRRVPFLARTRAVRRATAAPTMTVDRSRSRAEAVPLFRNLFGIRFGVPPAERPALEAAIREGLVAVRNPSDGRPIVESIRSGPEYFHGPWAAGVPDLIVELDPDYAASFRLGQYGSPVTETGPSVRGNHRMDGIFLAVGPDARQAAAPLEGLRIEDVAPTILHLLDVAIPADMEGAVLTSALAGDAGARKPRAGEPMRMWPSDDTAHYDDAGISAEDEQEIRERLEALGYLE